MSDCKPTPAAFILEKARQKYPEHSFIIMAQGPDGFTEITTNVIPSEVFEMIELIRSMTGHPENLERKPAPEI